MLFYHSRGKIANLCSIFIDKQMFELYNCNTEQMFGTEGRVMRAYPRKKCRRRAAGGKRTGRLIRHLVIMLFLVIALSGFCRLGGIRSMAQGSIGGHPPVRYYTCIQVEKGDTLWSIAERYRAGSDMSAAEYVNEIRRINSLAGTRVHAGHMLTVCYFR